MNEKYRMSVAMAAAMFASLSVFASIEFETAGASLRLSEKRGAIESLVAADGAERLAPSAEAFTLQLLDGKGEPTLLKSSDFAFESHAKSAKCAKSTEEKLSELGELGVRQKRVGTPRNVRFTGLSAISTL